MISRIKMPPACRETETVGETNISFVLSALHTDEKHSPTMGFPLPNARREGRPQLTRNRGMCWTPHCSNVRRHIGSTLLKLLDPQDRTVRWTRGRGRPTTARVFAYLKKVLVRDFLDLKKSSLYKTTVYPDSAAAEDEEDEDGEGGMTLDQIAAVCDTPEGETLRRERVQLILGQFNAGPELL